MGTTTKIHGRSAFRAKMTYRDDATDALVDLSQLVLFVEVAGGKIRKPLLAGAAPTERVIYLTREEVATIPTSATQLTIIDETTPGDESVLGERMIQRVGYIVR